VRGNGSDLDLVPQHDVGKSRATAFHREQESRAYVRAKASGWEGFPEPGQAYVAYLYLMHRFSREPQAHDMKVRVRSKYSICKGKHFVGQNCPGKVCALDKSARPKERYCIKSFSGLEFYAFVL